MLEAKGLSKSYALASGKVRALAEVSCVFKAAQVTAIVGPSGSGKSTLLHVLAGFDKPSSGSVWLENKDISSLKEAAKAELRLRQFGFVFQSFNLLGILTALQNVAFPMGLAGMARAKRLSKAKMLLERFGLAERLHHLPHKLSGGERQRVALARALANDPNVVFADEPTGNLDSKSGNVVLEALFAIAAEGRTVILITHDLAVAERAHECIYLKDGALTNAPGLLAPVRLG